VWPTGSFISPISHFVSVARVKEAVAEWVRYSYLPFVD